jgi:tetratricopeptide (TPR) repeat protein
MEDGMSARLDTATGQYLGDEEDHDAQASAFVARGCDHEHAQNWEAAIQSYNHALAADPRDPFIRYFANNNLGYSLIQVGRFDEAEEYCEAAIEINPAQYNAHKNLGLAREGQGRWLDAALSLAEAARLCPANTRAWLHLQQLLARKPWLLSQQPGLARDVAAVEAIYSANGGIPKLN